MSNRGDGMPANLIEAADLLWMREAQQSLMQDRCIIGHYRDVLLPAGGRDISYVWDTDQTPCRLIPYAEHRPVYESNQAINNAVKARRAMNLILPVGTTITAKDRVKINEQIVVKSDAESYRVLDEDLASRTYATAIDLNVERLT